MGSKRIRSRKKNGEQISMKSVLFLLKYVRKYTPGYLALELLLVIGNSIWDILVGMLYVKYLFDALEKGADYRQVLVITFCMIGYRMVLTFYGKWLANVYRPNANLKLHERMQTKLYERAVQLDLASYDNTAFYNEFIWAIRESDTRAVKVLTDVCSLCSCVITLVGMGAVFAAIDWMAALVVLASSVLGFFVRTKANQIRYAKAKEMNPITRKLDYFTRVFYQNEYAKELRMGNMGALLQEDYEQTAEEKIACTKKYAPKLIGISLASELITSVLFNVGLLGYLMWRYLTDAGFTLGDFSVGISATWKLFMRVNQLIGFLAQFQEHSIYAEKFRTFVTQKPRILNGIKKAEAFESLELRHVSFTYPFPEKNPKQVLSDISFTVRKGEKIAIVGYNGAGKTTLTKLLMRLYDVTDGAIFYNGADIRNYDISSYRAHIGSVFQDYKIFAATIGENVMGGIYTDSQKEAVESALTAAGFSEKYQKLPQKADTELTREFDEKGINLSGGEGQKIAIARAFAKNSDILILDEPSSALDPIAEYELNKTIEAAAKDRTVIFISHRLSTTRMADRIYLFDGGKITEQGSHEELMGQDGTYAKMFRVQAKKYQG